MQSPIHRISLLYLGSHIQFNESKHNPVRIYAILDYTKKERKMETLMFSSFVFIRSLVNCS